MSIIAQNLPDLPAKPAEPATRGRRPPQDSTPESFDQVFAQVRRAEWAHPRSGRAASSADHRATSSGRRSEQPMPPGQPDARSGEHVADPPTAAVTQSADAAGTDSGSAEVAQDAAETSGEVPADHSENDPEESEVPAGLTAAMVAPGVFEQATPPTPELVQATGTIPAVAATTGLSASPADEPSPDGAPNAVEKSAAALPGGAVSGVRVPAECLPRPQVDSITPAVGVASDDAGSVESASPELEQGLVVDSAASSGEEPPGELPRHEQATAPKAGASGSSTSPTQGVMQGAGAELAMNPTMRRQPEAAPSAMSLPAASTASGDHAQARFMASNHPQIVSAVRGQLLPTGGTMQIRLDPPELGSLLITVNVRHGVIDAAFQTASDQATQLLSHGMTALKHALESQGVSVERLQVAQTPRHERGESQQEKGHSQLQNESARWDWERHGDQQRREMLKRMWAKLGVGDPLDLVA